jgi:cytochrome c
MCQSILRRLSSGLLFAVICVCAPASWADDIKAGEKVFKKCMPCHTIEKNGKNRIGPNLYGIVGAEVAKNEAFAKIYSKALKAYGGIWSVERLDAFLTEPKAEVKKTKMSFRGLKKAAQRKVLIAYLNSYRNEPVDLEGIQNPPSNGEANETESDFGVLIAASGAEETFAYCTACHSERIVAQQGLTKSEWEEMLVWMVEEQEMDAIVEPDLTLIINYLATNYNVDRPNFPK